jgi:hypothetical protein
LVFIIRICPTSGSYPPAFAFPVQWRADFLAMRRLIVRQQVEID